MTETYDAEKKKIVDNRAREVFGPVWWKDQTSLFVMHFASLSTLPENELVGDAIFMLGLDWLSDLQRLAASHVNRLGRLSIKSKE